MPIPTRLASLREPRKPTISSIVQPTATTTTTTTTAAGTTRPLTRPTHDKAQALSNPSPVEASSGKDNVLTSRGRTFLPQRSNPFRDGGNGLGHGQLQSSWTSVSQRDETSPKRHQQRSANIGKEGPPSTAATGGTRSTRRQSLARSGGMKVSSTKSHAPVSTKPTASTTSTFVPPSPREQPPMRLSAKSTLSRPPSPKKTDMPPPTRSTRSASLRQPVGVGSGPPIPVRGHARHRSQMISSQNKLDPGTGLQKSRPQFSAYQQHYSPKKPAKPPTPTQGEAPDMPGDLIIPMSWPDVAALQAELLQLTLFHSNSLQKQAEWKSETEAQLRKQYDAVAAQYRSTLEDEGRRQRHLNLQALDSWFQNCRDHKGQYGFSEQIQILSRVLQDVPSIVSSGLDGRYDQAVESFELWLRQAVHTRYLRESLPEVDRTTFVEPLDQTWKDELQTLHMKLEMCARQLLSLDILGFGKVERLDQSALARVVQSLNQSIELMILEIQAMRTIEAELVRSEREMVSKLTTQLMELPQQTSMASIGVWRH